jgi:VCBS repeat-containing protein
MGPVHWLSRLLSLGTNERSARARSVDPRQSLYPEYFVTALEPRRVLNAAPVIDPQSFTVQDDAQAGDIVGTVEASDPDEGDVISFSITAGNSGNVFAIHPDTGVITVNNAGPLGNQTTYELTVQVTDQADATAQAVMTITVVPPPTPPVVNDQFFIVPAGSEAGTPVGQVEVDDVGEGDLTFSIVSGNDDDAFAIHPETGQLTVADQTALTTPGTRILTVRVDDIEGGFDTAAIEIRVNAAPTAIDLSNDQVPENSSGAVIGTVIVTDPNPDDSFTFELDDDRFEIVEDQLKLKEDVQLNFEQEASIQLNITAFDEAGASLTQLFVIEVLDRNDPPTDIFLDASPVEENNPGAIIGLVTVEDEDDPNTSFGTHEFLVMEEDGTQSSRLYVDDNLQLRLVDGEFFNFEVEPEVVIRILATDNPDEVDGEPRLSVERTFTITVLDVNDPPVAFDKNFTTPENVNLEGNVLVGSEDDPDDFDEDGDPLSVVMINDAAFTAGEGITLSSGATLVVQSNGDFIYDASTSDAFQALPPGDQALDSFSYTITDGQDEFATATVSITVVGVNNPPVAFDKNFTTPEDVPLSENLLVGSDDDPEDFDPEGEPLTVTHINGEDFDPGEALILDSGATLFVQSNGDFIYDASTSDTFQALPPGDQAFDSFSYTITDGANSVMATVSITVVGVNNPPVAFDKNFTTPEDVPLSENLLVGSDDDPEDFDPEGAPLTVTHINGSTFDPGDEILLDSGATLFVQSNGDFVYDASTSDTFQALPPGDQALDSFSYTITDGANSVMATVSITVVGVNNPPVAFDKNFNTPEDVPLSENLLVGSDDDPEDFDPEGDPLTVTQINGDTLEPGEGIPLDSGATLVVQSNGDFIYDASTSDTFRALLPGEQALDSFSYTISDGMNSVTATVNITVVGVNNPPVAFDKNFTTPENVPLNENLLIGSDDDSEDFDPEGDPLTVTLINGVFLEPGGVIDLDSGATLVVQSNGDFIYDASTSEFFRALPSGAIESDEFHYTISDGEHVVTATVSITVIGSNNPPSFEFSDDVQNAAQAMIEDEVLDLPGVLFESFTDDETAPEDATYRILETSFGVTVEVIDGGGLRIIPLANYNGPAWVVVEAEDTGGVSEHDPILSASATLTIWIEPVNDPPTLVDETFSTPEFTLQQDSKDPLTGNVLQNAFDVDTDPILNQGLLALDGVTEENLAELFGIDFTSVEFVSGGVLNLDGSYTLGDAGVLYLFPNGEFSFLPERSYFGIETFEYRVSDMQGATSTGTVRLKVTPINDPPEFTLETNVIELDPLNPSVIVITDAVPGPPNEIAPNDDFPKAASQTLTFSVTSSNPSFLPASSIQFNQVDDTTTWHMIFPVLPFRNEVVQLVVRAQDDGKGPGINFSEQTVEVRVIVGQVPASSRQFERSEPSSFPPIESVEIPPATTVTPVVTVTPLQQAGSSSQSAAQAERQVVVYLVTSDRSGQLQEEAKLSLSPDMLNDLNSIFQFLPDDRFRIYLHLEDNSRRLVLDVYVRDGRPFNPDDLDDEIILPDPLEMDAELEEYNGDPGLPPDDQEGTEHDGINDLTPLNQLPSLEAPRRGAGPTDRLPGTDGALFIPDSTDQPTRSSLRWGLVAGGAALLGTRKQQRAEAMRALADFGRQASRRFLRD